LALLGKQNMWLVSHEILEACKMFLIPGNVSFKNIVAETFAFSWDPNIIGTDVAFCFMPFVKH
jgi:hypothetical protein